MYAGIAQKKNLTKKNGEANGKRGLVFKQPCIFLWNPELEENNISKIVIK